MLKFISFDNVGENYELVYVYNYHSTSLVSGVSFVSEWFGEWSNIFGARSKKFEQEYSYAKKELIEKFTNEVLQMYPQCNVVMNFKIDYEPLSMRKGIMFMLIGQGTPCTVKMKTK